MRIFSEQTEEGLNKKQIELRDNRQRVEYLEKIIAQK